VRAVVDTNAGGVYKKTALAARIGALGAIGAVKQPGATAVPETAPRAPAQNPACATATRDQTQSRSTLLNVAKSCLAAAKRQRRGGNAKMA
jgi:hypothetical protein